MIEKVISDLKKVFSFKETTREGDVVLIVAEHILYAIVTEITRDDTRRDEWWGVGMQLLTVPPQKVTWTLREPQFTGQEIFTMGGEKRFIKAIEFSEGQPKGTFVGRAPVKGKEKKANFLKVVK